MTNLYFVFIPKYHQADKIEANEVGGARGTNGRREKSAISFLKDAYPVKFLDIKIIPTTESDIKSIIRSPK
jgi:hypothetical protein